MGSNPTPSACHLRDLIGEKPRQEQRYDGYLPVGLLREDAASRRLDVPGAIRALTRVLRGSPRPEDQVVA